MFRALAILLLAITIGHRVQAAESRTVFVQLFEWPWEDIARECEDVLGPAGFAAVQISPPQEHLDWPGSPWWTRYQPISYKLISRSGDENQFKDMVRRCKAAGVDIYVDAVFNHMAGMAGGTGIGGSHFSQYQYPGLYADSDFHHCGRNGNDDIVNFSDRFEVQNCELVNLADLKTESTSVQKKIAGYMNSLLQMGVAGFRIDAAKHIPASDIKAIVNRLSGSPYIFQELVLGYNENIQYSEYHANGDVSDYVYPFSLAQAFLNQNLNSLSRIGLGPIASSDAIVFLTNHDLERSPSSETLSLHSNDKLYHLAQVFMLTWPYGYPQVYSGYHFSSFDQGPPIDSQKHTLPILNAAGHCHPQWTCEHRNPEVLNLVRFRNKTNSAFSVSHYWSNGSNRIAFARGDLGFVVINSSIGAMTETLSHGLPPGRYCNLLDTSYDPVRNRCAAPIVIGRGGRTTFNVPALSALVLLRTP